MRPRLASTLLTALLAAALAVLSVVACAPAPSDYALDGVVRPEHPRPDLRRDTFVNLNVRWDFAFDPDDVGLDAGWAGRDDVWDHEIQVPFAWDAPLSGVAPDPRGEYGLGATLEPDTYRGVAWYRLRLPPGLPRPEEGRHWWIVFGAVDFHADVFVDGREAASHDGGYAPFAVDLTAAGAGEAPTIVVRVEDDPEHGALDQPVGKQGSVWYTRTSGIWQTVYLETRPAYFLTHLAAIPDLAAGAVTVEATLNRPAAAHVVATAALDGREVGRGEADTAGADPVSIRLSLTDVRPWAPEHPTLYDLTLEVHGEDGGTDRVRAYFGLAEVGTGWLPGRAPEDGAAPADQGKAFLLNGEPRLLRCVLDQSYNPGGVYTAPDLALIREDLETARRLGFNCIRLHIKTDEPVKLRLADELGLLVVQDIPSLDMFAKNVPGFSGRRWFEEGMRDAILRDRIHPSILMWVVFNENWGLDATGDALLHPKTLAEDADLQAWVRETVAEARRLDPTRPVEDNSAGGAVGVFEHLDTDSNSFHWYQNDAAGWRDFLATQAADTFPGSTAHFVGGAVQDGDPWWTSEFANDNVLGANHDPGLYCNLYGMFNELRRRPRLAGFVLTQLTDVEYEESGLLTYQRDDKDLCVRGGVGLADVAGDAFVGFEWLPDHAVPAGEPVDVPLFFSDWTPGGALGPLTAHLAWDDAAAVGDWAVPAAPYDVAAFEATGVRAPTAPGAHTLVAEVRDAAGARICASWIAVEVAGGP